MEATVIVPADEAATLPARSFVVHTANIAPTTCETCGGYGWEEYADHAPECYVKGDCVGCGGVQNRRDCPTCNGEGTVPAVVTLAVKCEHEGAGRLDCFWCRGYGFRPVGTATVAHCWPIVDVHDPRLDEDIEVVYSTPSSTWVQRPDHGVDITGQVVGPPAPGAFLLELTDVKATS